MQRVLRTFPLPVRGRREGGEEYPLYCRLHRDRCRTTNNMLGDCYAAAVVEALSRKELEAMDRRAGKEETRGQGQGPGDGAETGETISKLSA